MLCKTACVSTLIAAAAVSLNAQATGRLEGSVSDPAEATVVGAQVLCRNVGTGLNYTAVTNVDGIFRYPELPIGSYELVVSKEGFQRLVRPGVDLLTGHTVDLKLRLQIGSVSESVEVKAVVPLVQSATSEVQTTMDSRAVTELPLNGRNPLELVVLTPGADFTATGTSPGQQDNTGVTVNGLRSTDNNYQLDGASFTNNFYGSAPTLPNPDTLGEFTVQSSNFSARESRAGALVQLSTRSGANKWSGSVFEFFRNDKLDARNFFGDARSPFRRNQFGGSMGGPIQRNKTFVFGSYQSTIKRGGPSPKLLTVPTAAQQNGDFSALASRIIVDPLTRQPFPGSIIPQGRFDPIAVRLLQYIPHPNAGTNILRSALDEDIDDHQFLVKVDHHYRENNNLSIRYYYDRNRYQRDTASVPGVYAVNNFRNHQITIRDTRSLSPTLTTTSSFSYSQNLRDQFPNSPVYSTDLTDKIIKANARSLPELRVNIANYFNFMSGGPLQFDPTGWEYRGQMAWSYGAHLIGFGGDLYWSRLNAVDNSWGTGQWNFDATRTSNTAIAGSQGDSFASFLLGVPASFRQLASDAARFAEDRYQFWFQDDWKIHSRFTLNLGFRWEPTLPARDSLGPLPALVPGLKSKVAPDAPVGLVFSGDVRDSIFPADWNNFAPRIGFAWDLTGGGKTILRAGYGVYYRATPLAVQRAIATGGTFRSLDLTFNDPASFADPWLRYPGGNPYPYTTPGPGELSSYRFRRPVTTGALDPNTRTGYTQSWNLTLERQVLPDMAVSLAYVGNRTIGIIGGIEGNPALYSPGATAANIDNRRIYAGLAGVTFLTPWQWANYNSMQFTVTKRARHGLSVIANYVYAKAIDIGTNGGLGQINGQPRDPFNWAGNKGPADFDIKHRTNIALLYDLPKLISGNAFAGALVNGWQLNSIATIQSGYPVTVLSGLNRSLNGINRDHADLLGDPMRPAGVDPVAQWFNKAAFGPNAPGTVGTAGRNILRGPGKATVNFSAFKNFRMTERYNLQFRFEGFNVLNRANFELPTANTNNVNYGRILGAFDPRVIQLGLKLLF